MGEHGPSDKAIQAARRFMGDEWLGLQAAHVPDLGLDRSVCLRDVVELLRKHAHPVTGSVYGAPDLVERVFTETVVSGRKAHYLIDNPAFTGPSSPGGDT